MENGTENWGYGKSGDSKLGYDLTLFVAVNVRMDNKLSTNFLSFTFLTNLLTCSEPTAERTAPSATKRPLHELRR